MATRQPERLDASLFPGRLSIHLVRDPAGMRVIRRPRVNIYDYGKNMAAHQILIFIIPKAAIFDHIAQDGSSVVILEEAFTHSFFEEKSSLFLLGFK